MPLDNAQQDSILEQLRKLLEKLLPGWHPGWVITLVVLAILAFRVHKIIKAVGTYRNERLKILTKDERRRIKLRNAIEDRKRKGE